jgi:hypothetical protein
MRMRKRTSFVAIAVVVLSGLMAGEVAADETDNFTCRSRPMRDALAQLDALMNARIREAVARANRRAGARCDAACLERLGSDELRETIGSSYRPLPTLIPHAVFMKSVSELPDLDRCHLRFGETIYGARAYNRPWMYPFHRRIIFVADSIRLAGRVVGLDKMNHFIREGLVHWRAVNERGATIASDIKRELGSPTRHSAWTEQGLKGMGLTGVLAYADLAASYSGFRFWSDLLAVGGPRSFVEFDRAAGRLHQVRTFSFAAYVNDAWDETINRSKLDATLRQEVEATIRRRGLSPGGECRHLAVLPDADLYVNPECLAAGAGLESRH